MGERIVSSVREPWQAAGAAVEIDIAIKIGSE